MRAANKGTRTEQARAQLAFPEGDSFSAYRV
jgi:hypothetical protein